MVVGWALGWLDDCKLQKFGTRVGFISFVANRGLDVLQGSKCSWVVWAQLIYGFDSQVGFVGFKEDGQTWLV